MNKDIMTKQKKIEKLKKSGYIVKYCMSINDVILCKDDFVKVFMSIDAACEFVFGNRFIH